MGIRSGLALMAWALAVAGCRAPRPVTAGERLAATQARLPIVPRPANGQVEKVREELTVTPLEVVFSGVRGEPPRDESVAIRNTGGQPVQLAAVELVGQDASVFRLTEKPPVPMTLFP